MRNVIGAMMPCHSPTQNPATSPDRSGTLRRLLDPGAHAARRTSKRITAASATFLGRVIYSLTPPSAPCPSSSGRSASLMTTVGRRVEHTRTPAVDHGDLIL